MLELGASRVLFLPSMPLLVYRARQFVLLLGCPLFAAAEFFNAGDIPSYPYLLVRNLSKLDLNFM